VCSTRAVVGDATPDLGASIGTSLIDAGDHSFTVAFDGGYRVF
jgi:hypothetical protein